MDFGRTQDKGQPPDLRDDYATLPHLLHGLLRPNISLYALLQNHPRETKGPELFPAVMTKPPQKIQSQTLAHQQSEGPDFALTSK